MQYSKWRASVNIERRVDFERIVSLLFLNRYYQICYDTTSACSWFVHFPFFLNDQKVH